MFYFSFYREKKNTCRKKWTDNPLFAIVQGELRACVVKIEHISFDQRSSRLPGPRLRIQVESELSRKQN